MRKFKAKAIVEGECKGEAVVIDKPLSFFGEVDPYNGVVKPLGVSIADKVLVIPGTRGSTVGSYVIYALREYGKAPSCIVACSIEPILVIGCVIADIPLYMVEGCSDLIKYLAGSNGYIEAHDGWLIAYAEEGGSSST